MNVKSIKKEIALFLLAGYETVEAVILGLIKYRVFAVTIALLTILAIITVCFIRPEVIVVFKSIVVFSKWALPASFLSVVAVRYLLG